MAKKQKKVGPMYVLNRSSNAQAKCVTVPRKKPKKVKTCGCTLGWVCYQHQEGATS